MRLPGTVLKGIGGEKRRGITAISLIAMVLASICGIVWGLNETKVESEVNESNFCRLETPEAELKAELKTEPNTRIRRSCTGCGRG